MPAAVAKPNDLAVAVRRTYSIPEVAKILGISTWSAYELAKNGKLPVIKLGRRRVVPDRALEKMLEGNA
ncbi:MAG: helix-turn-helix domain-containing protein [Bradyrhizobiaceae bacterium]|nr:helix-turn-helix domain-containing protein [Bradyrhizobiaceae bacterium]